MPLNPGTTLGPYEIEAPLGAGGMGEVYKATDTRLDRTVAIKVLPEHVANDPDLRQRFEREAKTISSLNHPHICTLYDIGKEGETDFLVMEYLDGQTLAQRLEKGALPLNQALTIATEIADALDKAHRQGIVHRDLKPGNIMLTKAGAKLLDFGLAKLRKPGMVGADGFSAATTLSEPLTARGTILGTLPYMAPEQLEGKDTDARTDVFAFGAIVYEMVTGRRVFAGDSQASLIAAILSSQPNPMSTIEPITPLALERVVTKCLAKDPDERWHSAHDLTDELKWIVQEGTVSPPAGAATLVRPAGSGVSISSKRGIFAVGVAAVLVIAAGVLTWRAASRSEPALVDVTRLTVTLPAGQELARSAQSAAIALSPDGTRLAYVARRSGSTRLYLRGLDAFGVTELPGTEDARHPFFSPDGEWVGFFADGLLQKVAVAGGLPLTICEAPVVGAGATWGPDGTIIFEPGSSGSPGLLRVSADGGDPEPWVTGDPDLDQRELRWPSFLPDGRALLLNVGPQIAVVPLDGGAWSTLAEGNHPRYVAPGYLVYYEARGGLQAVGFDAERHEIVGSPVSVLDSVYRAPAGGAPFFEVSQTGSLVYLSGGLERSLMWVDRDGQASPVTEERRGFRFPRLSPDGSKVAVIIDPRPSEVWVYDLERNTRSLLFDVTHAVTPRWTADGTRVIFSAGRPNNLQWMPADGSGDAEPLLTRERHHYAYSVSRDGRFLSFQEQHPTTDWDIWVLPLEGDRVPEPFLVTSSREVSASFSPDGQWAAYMSDTSGEYQVYVQPFRGSGPRVPISTDGGSNPAWSADGRELFYREGENRIMVVAVETGSSFVAGTPEILVDGAYYNPEDNGGFDVSADGRFLMVRPDPTATGDRLQVVLNWVEELKARVPTN